MPPPPRPDLESLLGLAPSETTPVLLELARRQSARKRPTDLLTQRERDRFVPPSLLDLRPAHRLDGLALEAAAGFEALLLSPVAPLGVSSVVAPGSQDRVLTTMRGTEVVSDPTNVLALESALRLKNDPGATVRLTTVHQTLRAQPLPPQPGFSRHFRLFVLTEAGLGRSADSFEVEAIARHVHVFDRLFDLAQASFSLRFPGRRVILRTDARHDTLGDRAAAGLAAAMPHVPVARERLESRYYAGVRVTFGADSAAGEFVPIGDLGVFDWMARLTGHARQRFVASGFGLQLLPVLFGSGEAVR